MKKVIFFMMGLFLLSVVTTALGQPPGSAILEFKNMAGVIGPFVGNTNPIRGIVGGGVPWAISDGRGELHADGKLEVKVKGLVLVTTGTNPAANFRAIVSCMIIDSNNNPAIVNVSTGTSRPRQQGMRILMRPWTSPTPALLRSSL